MALADFLLAMQGSQPGGLLSAYDIAGHPEVQEQMARASFTGNPANRSQMATAARQGNSAPMMQPGPSRAPQASPASSGGGLGGLLANIFNPGQSKVNQTVQWLMRDGMDEGTATFLAQNRQGMQSYITNRMAGKKPIEINGRLVDPVTYEVLADFSDKGKDLIDAGKGRLYDPNTQKWITAPDMGTDAPTVQTFFDKNGQEYKAQWSAQERKWVPVGGSKVPSGGITVTSPDGTTMTLGGAGQKLTEGQSKDIAYYTQGVDANQRLAGLEGELTSFAQQNAELLPLGVGNYLRTPEFRQAKQAAERFLTSVLRKETGAAVTETEWQRYGPMFLPIPGDDPGTLQQKKRAREVALLAIRSGLGTAEAVAAANRITLGFDQENGGLTPQPGAKQPTVIDGYTIEEVE